MRSVVSSMVCLLVLATLSTSSVAATAGPQTVSGPFSVHTTNVTVEPIGDLCRVTLTGTFSFSGSLVGAFTAPFNILHLGSCTSPSTEVFVAQAEYRGSVLGRSGSFSFVFSGSIDPQGHAQGDLFILHASDGLAGLNGTLQITGQSGIGGTYAGTVAFDS